MTNEREAHKLLKWLSKPIIAINWFSDSVQAGLIVIAEDENWIKINANVANQELITCIAILQIMP